MLMASQLFSVLVMLSSASGSELHSVCWIAADSVVMVPALVLVLAWGRGEEYLSGPANLAKIKTLAQKWSQC